MSSRKWSCQTCRHWKPDHTKVANNVYGNVAPCTVMLPPKTAEVYGQRNKTVPFWAQGFIHMTKGFEGEGCYTWEAKP